MRGLFGKKDFCIDIRETVSRDLLPNYVRLKVLACGVCGTDLHFLRDMDEWTPMGHEISAIVVETGKNVTNVRVGDTVICEDVTLCGKCEACKSGNSSLCRDGYTLDGQPGMGEELVVHENMLNVFRGIDPIVASMTEPLAVAIRGMKQLNPQPMSSMAIYGMGTIGLFSAAYARLCGVGRIALFAKNPNSMRNKVAEDIADAYGVDEIYYTGSADYESSLARMNKFDAAIVAAPHNLCDDALRIVRYGGRVLAMGVSFGASEKTAIDINDMVFNKKQLLTSIAEPAENFPLSIELIRSGRIDVSKVITHKLRIDEAGKLAELYKNDAPAVKTVILCND